MKFTFPEALIGAHVTELIAGAPAGSIITLILSVDGVERFSFQICCVWRLETDRHVITGWNEDNTSNGPMVTGLKTLEKSYVAGIQVSNMGDLNITFRNGATLILFCDQTPNIPEDEAMINWRFADMVANKSFVLSHLLEIEERSYR
jgi:hypothetical protein